MPALPSGTILLWSGSIATIPAGFVLCNGANGTPDLRDRFLVGAGSAYDPDDNAFVFQHSHTFTSVGHDHDFVAGTGIAAGADYDLAVTTEQVPGLTDDSAHLPPFYALAYIMKT